MQEWHGWIFANRGADDQPSPSTSRASTQILDRYDGADLVTVETHEYDVEANWKVIVENYQECYHCSSIHPELCRVSPPDSGENLAPQGRLGRRRHGPARRHGHHVSRRHTATAS